MSHSITGKLNKPARQHQGNNGMTFFISLGEKNYDFKTKGNVWTNYDVALFAKDAQIQFYAENLVEGAIVSVSGTGLILDVSNAQYPKLSLQDAKLGFVSGGGQPVQQQQQAPAPQQQYSNQSQQQQQQPYAAPQQQTGGFMPQNNGQDIPY
tara:strand:- start:325 stop:780 length:456 start_codon:yes stop_codon:yes gene_type:complete